MSKCANSLLKRSPIVVKLGIWFQKVPAKSHHCHSLLPAKYPLQTYTLCNFLSSINWLFTFLSYLSVWLFLSKSAFAVFSLSASSSWTKLQSIFMIIIQTIVLDNSWTIPRTLAPLCRFVSFWSNFKARLRSFSARSTDLVAVIFMKPLQLHRDDKYLNN